MQRLFLPTSVPKAVARSRFDFPDRDDENWLCHSLYLPESESMTRRSVNMEPKLRPAFPPKIRTY